MKIILQLAMLQFLGMFLVYTVSQAAPAKTIARALSSPTVSEIESQFPKNVIANLKKIEEVASYRCPNCFDLKLSYSGISTQSGRPVKFSKLIAVRGNNSDSLLISEIKP